MGDAVLAEQALDLPLTMLELVGTELGQDRFDTRPMVPDRTVGGQHLVVAAGEAPVWLRRRGSRCRHLLSRCDAALGTAVAGATAATSPSSSWRASMTADAGCTAVAK